MFQPSRTGAFVHKWRAVASGGRCIQLVLFF